MAMSGSCDVGRGARRRGVRRRAIRCRAAKHLGRQRIGNDGCWRDRGGDSLASAFDSGISPPRRNWWSWKRSPVRHVDDVHAIGDAPLRATIRVVFSNGNEACVAIGEDGPILRSGVDGEPAVIRANRTLVVPPGADEDDAAFAALQATRLLRCSIVRVAHAGTRLTLCEP